MVVKREMHAARILALLLPVLALVPGCGADSRGRAEELAALRQQVAALTRQVEEARERVDTLQNSLQENHRELSSLRAEVERLKQRPASAPARAQTTGEQPPTPAAPASRQTQPVSCAQVWRLLGQGKDETAVARTLDVSPEMVRACEEQVGRTRPRP